LSGTGLPFDRDRVRELLGFGALCENTLDSVAAEGQVIASAAAMASPMTIIRRLCQDLYIWSSQEFALIDIADAFSSRSSLMPQKKNARPRAPALPYGSHDRRCRRLFRCAPQFRLDGHRGG
jgi:argininosuccinate lyase